MPLHRCHSTLKKSVSLLRAAAQVDRDVLKTLDVRKRSRRGQTGDPRDPDVVNSPSSLNGVGTASPNNSKHDTSSHFKGNRSRSSSAGGDNGGGGVLKRQPTQDRNPLKSRKVYFGGTHYNRPDSEREHGDQPPVGNDTTGNHTIAGDENQSKGGGGGEGGGNCKTVGGHEDQKASRDKVSSPQKKSSSEKKGSWLTFHPIDNDNSPTRSLRRDKNQNIEGQLVVQGKKISRSNLACSMCGQKSQSACGESTGKDKKLTEQGENLARASETDVADRNIDDDEDDAGNMCVSKSRTSVSHSERRNISSDMRDRKDNGCVGDANPKGKTPRQDTSMASEPKCKYTHKIGRNAGPGKSNSYVVGDNTDEKSLHASITLSSESRNKRSPVKTLVPPHSKPPSDRTDNFSTGQPEHDGDSDETSSVTSDSESSPSTGSCRGRSSEGKGQRNGQPQRIRGHQGGQRGDVESPEERNGIKSSAQSLARTKGSSHTPRSREINAASSDTGRRRVVFSDMETNEVRSRASSASGSQDRGILKKPSDSNNAVKTVVVREDKVVTSRVRLNHRSHSRDSDKRSVSSRSSGIDYHSPSRLDHSPSWHRGRGGQTRGEDSKKTHIHAQDAFTPERASESSQSHSSSSSSSSWTTPDEDMKRKGQDPWVISDKDLETKGQDSSWVNTKMKDLAREDVKLKSFMKEQKRLLEEEDRMNRLISKYANNRRGLSGLSKNYNNSETAAAVPQSGDFSLATTVAAGVVAVESGRADRLDFDTDKRHADDMDSTLGRSVTTAPLVEIQRQPKVCAVRPIHTESSDRNQNENPGVEQIGDDALRTGQADQPLTHTVKTLHSNPSLFALLKQCEVTAGQFFVCPEEEVSENCASQAVEEQGKESSGMEGQREEASGTRGQGKEATSSLCRLSVPHRGKSSPRRNKCEWTAQRYSDSQTDHNNNLSSACDTTSTVMINSQQKDQTSANSQLSYDFAKSSVCSPKSPTDKVLQNAAGSMDCGVFAPVIYRNSSLTYSKSCDKPSIVLDHRHLAHPEACPHFSNMAAVTSKDATVTSSRFSGSEVKDNIWLHDNVKDKPRLYDRVKDKPWLYDTGYECYSAEEKLALPDSRFLLCQDIENKKPGNNTGGYEKPLKSCLKRRASSSSVNHQKDRSIFTHASTTYVETHLDSNATENFESKENYPRSQRLLKSNESLKTCQLERGRTSTGSPCRRGIDVGEKAVASSKLQKRVQFREPHKTQDGGDSNRKRNHGATERLCRQASPNLNVSNNSNALAGCRRHKVVDMFGERVWTQEQKWSPTPRPSSVTHILVCLSERSKLWCFLIAQRLLHRGKTAKTKTHGRDEVLRGGIMLGADRNSHTAVYIALTQNDILCQKFKILPKHLPDMTLLKVYDMFHLVD
ncbi:hypothetical protein ElyMa_001304900 [Elysia marginata]|uniref:SPOC domain-containing protein n=1 Tax=Elysia marginata TaxID=1093978 RepID=A0AAV4IHH4_9GAST|nr:hypothetical protein ElyMa_001304900 [Elysia marginata]